MTAQNSPVAAARQPAPTHRTVTQPAPTQPALTRRGLLGGVAAAARSLAGRLPRAELAVLRGGRHDVLNDASHRTVAAHVVQWLERLRLGPDAEPILHVEHRTPEPIEQWRPS